MKSDTPDTPPEVLANQAKSRALTPQTAELLGSTTYIDESGKTVDGYTQAVAANTTARKARQKAEAYAGGTPVMGLSPEKVAAIKGRSYPKAPKMDAELGDRTPAFVNWLWSNHPGEAKVRYAYRDIWPTSLPAAWPPKAPATIRKAGAKPAVGTVGTTTGQTVTATA